MKTKIKVCGMRDAANIRQVLDLKPDYMGFIFYPQSARYFPELSTASMCSLSELIKAFGVDDSFDFSVLGDYMDAVDYFLFDTKTKGYGGSGKTFSWNCLKGYSFQKPYFLSGGIGPDNFTEAYSFEDEMLYAVDMNSRFESSPGLKEISLLSEIFKISKYE